MARYVIDAPTLLHLVDAGLHLDPGHQLVAPNSIRSEALELLLHDVRAGKRTEAAALEAHLRDSNIGRPMGTLWSLHGLICAFGSADWPVSRLGVHPVGAR
jgi:hypothetical protein